MFSLGVLFFILLKGNYSKKYNVLLRKMLKGDEESLEKNGLLNKKMEKIIKRRNENWKKIGLTKVLNKQKKN